MTKAKGSKKPKRAKAKTTAGGAALLPRDFAARLRDEMQLPADAHVIGEPVTVIDVRDSNLPRVGFIATCRRGDRTYDVSLADVVFPPGSAGSVFAARYRAWLGLRPSASVSADDGRPHKIVEGDVAVGRPIDLVVLACKTNAIRCRLLGTAREVTLRTAVRDEVPGSIVTVIPTKEWTHARHPYLTGAIQSTRVDVRALGLTPLALNEEGEWDPADEYWGEDDEPIGEWAKPIIARGRRPMFELQQVIPGADPEDFDSDPIVEAAELREAGDLRGARDLLMRILAKDLRCIDAHAHLGNIAFDWAPTVARKHYEMGAAIAALSLGEEFAGVLPWGLVDNRPFLRCLHGAGLCAWRLRDVDAAKATFTRMLWLNPGDNQGVRFCLAAVEAGRTWEEMEDDGGMTRRDRPRW